MRHQKNRMGHKGKGWNLNRNRPRSQGSEHGHSAGWGLGWTAVPEQAQGIAQSLSQVWGTAQLLEMGGKVSISTAISGHKSHKEGLPATEDQLGVVPIEVHLWTRERH